MGGKAVASAGHAGLPSSRGCISCGANSRQPAGVLRCRGISWKGESGTQQVLHNLDAFPKTVLLSNLLDTRGFTEFQMIFCA